MQPKTLLLLSVTAFGSCTTAYKSGQTPDDVYYSPVRLDADDENNNNNNRDEAKNETPEDNTIRMRIRDYRWRDFDDDYSYNNSPYHYCTCNCNNYGYYYNPKYHPWPIYLTKVQPANSTPRMVNLNAYTGYNSNAPVIDPKTGNSNGINWIRPSGQYSTPGSSTFGNLIRQALTPSRNSSSSSNNNSSSNNTRTYSPSSSSNSSSSSSSSSKSSGSSVSRPKRD